MEDELNEYDILSKKCAWLIKLQNNQSEKIAKLMEQLDAEREYQCKLYQKIQFVKNMLNQTKNKAII